MPFTAADLPPRLVKDRAVAFIKQLIDAGEPRETWCRAALASGFNKMAYFTALRQLGLSGGNGVAGKRGRRAHAAAPSTTRRKAC